MLRNSSLTLILMLVFAASGHAVVLEKIAAVVNERIITVSDLEDEMAISRHLGETLDKPQVIDVMIERELVAKEAGRLGIAISVDEITMSVLHFEETFPSKDEFDRFLKRYELNLKDLTSRFSMSIVVDKVRQQKDAISAGRYEKWLDEARKKSDVKIVNK